MANLTYLSVRQRQGLLDQFRTMVGEANYEQSVKACGGEDAVISILHDLEQQKLTPEEEWRRDQAKEYARRINNIFRFLVAYSLGLVFLVLNSIGHVKAALSSTKMQIPIFDWAWWYLVAAIPIGFLALWLLTGLFAVLSVIAVLGRPENLAQIKACLLLPGLGGWLAYSLIRQESFGWIIIASLVEIFVIPRICGLMAIRSNSSIMWRLNGTGSFVVGLISIIVAAVMLVRGAGT